MRKGAAVLAYMVVVSCRSPSAGTGVEPRARIATLASLNGSAEVLRGGAADWSPLQPGAEFFDEDRVRTFKGARASLSFPGGSSLRVEEESLISLGAISLGGGIVVERGTVEGELQPGLKVKTPSLEAETVSKRDIVIQ
jgi:hypothetical protein